MTRTRYSILYGFYLRAVAHELCAAYPTLTSTDPSMTQNAPLLTQESVQAICFVAQDQTNEILEQDMANTTKAEDADRDGGRVMEKTPLSPARPTPRLYGAVH
jgi:hypothetical protein